MHLCRTAWKTDLRTIAACLFAALAFPAWAAEGLIVVESPHGAADTMDRLVAGVEERGLKVFARIDHAAGAASVGTELRPTELLIFGSPKAGTPFMQCAQSVGIDLPVKALVWEDADGQVWLGWNDPAWIAARHDVPDCAVAGKLGEVLQGLAAEVVAP
jgi:uncharacterized protein (DUF302 family)